MDADGEPKQDFGDRLRDWVERRMNEVIGLADGEYTDYERGQLVAYKIVQQAIDERGMYSIRIKGGRAEVCKDGGLRIYKDGMEDPIMAADRRQTEAIVECWKTVTKFDDSDPWDSLRGAHMRGEDRRMRKKPTAQACTPRSGTM